MLVLCRLRFPPAFGIGWRRLQEEKRWRRCALRHRGRSLLGSVYDRVKWILGVSLLNLFPLPREAGFRESFAFAGESVDRGYSILVFPEGRHTTDGKMRPFRAGVGLLANNLAIPVVPMRIDGLFELKKAKKKFALPGKIQVKIGVAGAVSARKRSGVDCRRAAEGGGKFVGAGRSCLVYRSCYLADKPAEWPPHQSLCVYYFCRLPRSNRQGRRSRPRSQTTNRILVEVRKTCISILSSYPEWQRLLFWPWFSSFPRTCWQKGRRT